MAGGGDEMTVAGEDIKIIKTRVPRESVGHVAAHAFEALKEGGHADGRVMQVGELLEEIAAAPEDAEASADTGLHPGGVVEGGAFPAVFCGLENLKKRLEEFFADDRLAMSCVGHENLVMTGPRRQAQKRGKMDYLARKVAGR